MHINYYLAIAKDFLESCKSVNALSIKNKKEIVDLQLEFATQLYLMVHEESNMEVL